MSNDFELKIFNDKIIALSKEKEQLVNDLINIARNEQAELDKIKREFNIHVIDIKNRQSAVETELSNQRRNLESLKRRLQIEQDKKDYEKAEKKAHDDMRRRLK